MSIVEASQMELLSPALVPLTPQSQRSVSDVPSLSSSCSSSLSLSTLSTPENHIPRISRRPRGFLRPKGTRFSDSARNRESVMNLGSIAHIQHYFARTGLLDGKGPKGADSLGCDESNPIDNIDAAPSLSFDRWTFSEGVSQDSSRSIISYGFHDYDSLIGEIHHGRSFDMLVIPPTMSTYRQAPLAPTAPPSIQALRLELRDALADASSVLEGLRRGGATEAGDSLHSLDSTPSQGWYEIEGLHVLDLVTLAIRAAKEFYVCHDKPQRLHDIVSERQLRSDLHKVLDLLKRVAARNFAGGYTEEEIKTIKRWLVDVEMILLKEEKAEQVERMWREQWPWLSGEWNGRERYREWLFIKSFEPELAKDPLPAWSVLPGDAGEPSSFLYKLRDGKRLIAMHNAVVQASTRRFGEITTFHEDTEKPYRRSENLKFWIKAAELRWDVKLDVNVAKLVAADVDVETWSCFDAALLKWCETLREEITAECDGTSTYCFTACVD